MGHHDALRPEWAALDDLVGAVVDARRAAARAQAAESRLLAQAVDLVLERVQQTQGDAGRPATAGADLPLREVAAELGAAMRLSDRTVQARMGDATTLSESFPTTLAAWDDGEVDSGHVWAIVDAASAIFDAGARSRCERMLLDAARHESPARLRAIAKTLAARLDPVGAEERARAAQGTRRVRVIDLDDGMARLLADLPAALAHAIYDRLTQTAHLLQTTAPAEAEIEADAEVTPAQSAVEADCHLLTPPEVVTGPSGAPKPRRATPAPAGPQDQPAARDQAAAAAQPPPPAQLAGPAQRSVTGPDAGDEPRTMDELRADVFADLMLLGTTTAHGAGDALDAVVAHVQITVPVLTLAGRSDEPAILAGHGPIDLDTARRLAGGATGWDRVMTHPATGAVLAVDRYRPSAELRRFLRVRDEHCRHPGCRQPNWRCDVDHTVDAALGGATTASNLAYFCRRHHVLKHQTAWSVRQLGGGVLEWRGPTGRRYRDRPASSVCFVPADDPPF